LIEDIAWAKAMGFNGKDKTPKDRRSTLLYWADRPGLLREEMPSAYRYTRAAVEADA